MGAHRDPILELFRKYCDRGFEISDLHLELELPTTRRDHDIAVDIPGNLKLWIGKLSVPPQSTGRWSGWFDRVKQVAVTELLKYPMLGPVKWMYLHLNMLIALVLEVISKTLARH
jgi:hypothetical protein